MRNKKLSLIERQALQKFMFLVKKDLGANLYKVLLYGSKARGDSGPHSDVDVAVLVRKRTDAIWNKVMNAAFDVGLEFDVFVSPRVLPLELMTAKAWRIMPFIRNLKKDGIAL